MAVYPLVYLPDMGDDDEEEEDEKEEEEEKDENDVEIEPNDLLITGSADTSIKIWSLYSGECMNVSRVAFFFLLLHLCEVYPSPAVQTLRNHTGSVIALATDPTGQILYSFGSDSFIKYWDIKSGKQIKVTLGGGGEGREKKSGFAYKYYVHTYIQLRASTRTALPSSAWPSAARGSCTQDRRWSRESNFIDTLRFATRYQKQKKIFVQDGTAKCWVTEFGDNTVTYKDHRMSVTVVKFYKGLRKISTRPGFPHIK